MNNVGHLQPQLKASAVVDGPLIGSVSSGRSEASNYTYLVLDEGFCYMNGIVMIRLLIHKCNPDDLR